MIKVKHERHLAVSIVVSSHWKIARRNPYAPTLRKAEPDNPFVLLLLRLSNLRKFDEYINKLFLHAHPLESNPARHESSRRTGRLQHMSRILPVHLIMYLDRHNGNRRKMAAGALGSD